MVLGLFEDETYREWYDPIIKAIKGLSILLLIAVMFTSGGCLAAWVKIRDRQRVERETAERMAYAREYADRIAQAMLPSRFDEEPKPSPVEEPKPSPWFLGAWEKYLEEGKEKRN